MRRTRLFLLVLMVGLVAPALLEQSQAEAQPTLFGIRGGFTDDPDSIFFGGHLAIHPQALRRLRIEPSLELGLNDDLFALRVNGNFKVMFPVGRSVALYPVFGPYLYYASFDGGGDDTEFGLNLGGGVEISGFGFEVSAGLPDYPDFTFTVMYSFL
ncbi:hypothetical protein [Haliangium ochraceum]|uniref:Outer membrane protein beta-barrel domain-containing protein n=1 Tax=Haliangium ochraceum (strain DSM 14365 / JCM 11303 / SMP-2) TaxID=502025 RepID=D0LXJ2_HALO1|nr:hypothetical protein [Haliangium ochraceum]ACY17747.1 hypothetical protein Hoch_5262 [Haliangium ochraceum DSM 14365]